MPILVKLPIPILLFMYLHGHRQRGSREALDYKVEGGLMVLFFSHVFSIAPISPEKFSADVLVYLCSTELNTVLSLFYFQNYCSLFSKPLQLFCIENIV